MSAALLLVMPPGAARDELEGLLVDRGCAVACAQASDVAAAIDALPELDAVVHLPAENPFEGVQRLSAGEAGLVAAAAARAGARLVFCSSVLLYADGGDLELMANDPELDPPDALIPLAEAELDVFGSRAEVVVLRLGIALASGGSHAATLSAAVGDSGLRGGVHLPLLDRVTLADAIAAVAPSSLHGGWDVVSAVATLGEICAWLGTRGVPAAGACDPDELEATWQVSRLVTGAALRETGAVTAGEWQSIVESALA